MARRSVIPLALLLAYATLFAYAALGRGLLAFDDHPGQFYRLWHVITRGPAPWTWNPGWWTGYPEMQFYPPGFAYAGALLHALTLGRLPLAWAYQALLAIAWAAPGVTTWALLARRLGDGWRALPGAFVALTISAGLASGVEGGVHVGMLAARLGWALLPLLALALEGWIESDRTPPWLAAPLLAALALTHPAHLPAALCLVVAAAWLGGGRRRRRLAQAAAVLAVAAACTAFWTLPLVVRLEHTRALAWGSLAAMRWALLSPLALALVALAAAALLRPPSRADRVLAVLPWAMAMVVAGDALLLEPRGLRWLPADRVADGAALAVVLAAGLGAGRLLARLAPASLPGPALAVACVLVVAVLSVPGGLLTLWPRGPHWPAYAAIERGLRLADLWATLRAAPEGRVLFLRSGVPLVYGAAWYRPHTHVTALTPLMAGREIVHGTFTHPSPVAALVYRGDAGRGPLTELAERLDGHSLFGRALQAIDAGTFNRYADRLRVGAVVALDEDLPRLGALEGNDLFARRPAPAPFVLFVRRAGLPLPRETARGRFSVTLAGGAGEWVSAGVAYYPLWEARADDARLPTRRGDFADLEVRLPAADVRVELLYRAGGVEAAGVAVSGLGALGWLAAWVSTSARRRTPTRRGRAA